MFEEKSQKSEKASEMDSKLKQNGYRTPESVRRKRTPRMLRGFTPTRTLVSILMLVVLEMSLPRSCLSQEVNPTSSDLPPVTSSISPLVTSPAPAENRIQQPSEGFFFNGSSYAVISETLRLERGSHIGFSFRTCTSGELLRQTAGGDSLDEIRMSLNGGGSLVLTLAAGEQRIEEAIGSGLNDAQWHTVVLRVADDSDDLTLSVSHGANSSSATLGQSELSSIVHDLDLRANNPQLRVGAGLAACIREGPGVRFTKASAPVNSVAVAWGKCLLPETCSGYNWSTLTDARTLASCDSSVCQNGGICLPRLQAEESDDDSAASAGPFCLCQPGFTGPTCALLMSTCEESPCRNGAPCTEDPSGGTGYECQCANSSYQGRHCEIETPRCVQNSCQNGGTCLNQPAGFLCECTSGYTGLRCENSVRARSVNPCLSGESPCQNGGTCMYASATNSYTCICGSGFTGRDCETDLCLSQNCPQNSVCIGGTECKCLPGYQEIGSGASLTCEDIDECLSSPCINGGSCINLANSFRCQCPNGFNGTICETPIDYCAVNNRCQNGGTCRNLPESASIACDCPEGFSGIYCQDDVNECANVPSLCHNNAQCQNFKGGYSCTCEPGWSGTHCELNIDECLSDPCQNNATCNDLVNAFECVCTPGFEGTDCSINVDECAPAPCLNGGTCIDEINNFTCSCTPQFMGRTCDRAYNACVEQSCQNGGQCIVTKNERDPGNDFYCECPEGFNGLRCENNVNECEGVVCTDNKICVDLIASYQCRCPQGFAGDNCSVEIDECLSNPCQNGATCIDRTDGFDCRCASGWSGETCSDDLDECALNENLCNNGICRNTVGSYECYCRPGFSGNHCNHDFDECLSRPCQNDGTCSNLVNSYQCTCAAGFEGVNCEVNIDECASNSCQNNATCVDGINNFTCSCQPGFTGRFCETNINECESNPCMNNGSCIDGINSYVCLCDGTGFKGTHCEINIDECLVQPCQNNATCFDGINDYACVCFEGYGGKNCDQDISECLDNPCMNMALCFELSNTTLYRPELLQELPMDVKPYFEREFSYFNASGYVCSCMPGFEGVNCEIDIDECANEPCLHGTCTDGINEYICNCDPGYQGDNCEHEIDECESYQPCENGVCVDHIADYECQCHPGFGGKNCSVALTGCESVACLNGGTCTPWLIGESDHRANCTCTAGFDGLRCQSRTTFSLSGLSYIKVPSDRTEGYELHMKFRTTIGNGLVAIGQGNTHFSLQLRNGRLNLHSNLISKYEGIIIGENLNNTKWQKVYVAVNASHLTLGVNDQLQATQPINPTGDNDTVFFNTFIGGIVRDQEILANNAPSFTGCIQDIVVNEMKITEEDFKKEERGVEQVNTEPGCPRKDQCHPNPCQNEGTCTDLWSTYRCTCHRPFLGSSCQYNYTAATFGHENTTNSIAFVDILNPAPFRSGVDISMFIRTREESGFIFYFGSDLHHPQESYITGQLVKGNLVVNVTFDGKTERFQVYTVNLSDGNRHFIRVVRMNNSMMVKVNETVSINHEIPSPTAFSADKLYLGNFPTESADLFTPPRSTPTRTPHLTPSSTESAQTTTTTFTTTTPYDDPTTVLFVEGIDDLEENAETTLSSLAASSSFEEPSQEVFTTSTTQQQQLLETDSARFNEIAQNNNNNVDTTLNEESGTEREDVDEVSASPVLVARSKREQSSQQNDFGFTDLQDFKPPHFKGVIQDIRISDGGNVTRIVELFRLDFNDVVKPESVGEVHLIKVQKGVISDDTCRVDPCMNGGTCQVTWNDYRCDCPDGYKGRNCTEKEYCYWFVCPNGSECVSLIDGHECVSNATFNGVNSTVVVRPNDGGNLSDATITATFRTQRNGTLLHILGSDNSFIRLSVQGKKVVIEVPEKDSTSVTSVFGRRANDGKWHTIVVRFFGRILTAYMDSSREEQLSLDLSVDLNNFISSAEIIVGASHGHDVGSRDQYQFGSTSGFGEEFSPIPTTDLDIHTSGSYGDHFRGCIGEVRIGGILVPFFNDAELVNTTAAKRFVVESRQDVSMEGCVLCYEQECENGGVCQNPGEVFQCQCPDGFEDDVCSTNIDECVTHKCINGYCLDGIANYTCTCLPGWTGWLCDEDFDECLSSPCQNGGICEQTDLPGNYTCTCTDDFEGHNCQELKVKTCNEAPCLNGGTCKNGTSPNSDDLYTCDCTTAYKGVDCEIKKDFCEEYEFPCQNGATCISIDSTFYYKCMCLPGYTGQNCENEIDECDPNPCNTGKCKDFLNGYQCDCTGTGFEGNNCNINIDECLANPCIQGNCTDTPGSYHCDCLQGYCGTNCQREDPCQLTDGLCKNEGECRPSCDEPPFYQCACTSEWEGHNCTIKSPRRGGDIALIVGPVVGGILFIAVIAVLVFLIMARKKRKSEGKYKPATQELTSPRLQLDNIIKPPPEERLI